MRPPSCAGFYQAYLGGGFREQLLEAVAAAVKEQPAGEPLQLYLAGGRSSGYCCWLGACLASRCYQSSEQTTNTDL